MRTRIAQLFLLLMLAFPVLADEAEDAARLEQERQEAFQSGFAIIVESLNLGTFELFTSVVDRDNFFDLVFGLRLIDQEVKKNFIERVQQQFDGVLRAGFRDSKEGINATLLGVESRGDRGGLWFALICPACNSAITNMSCGSTRKIVFSLLTGSTICRARSLLTVLAIRS